MNGLDRSASRAGHVIGGALALLVLGVIGLVAAAFVAVFVWYFVGALVGEWKLLAVGFGLVMVAALGAAVLDR